MLTTPEQALPKSQRNVSSRNSSSIRFKYLPLSCPIIIKYLPLTSQIYSISLKYLSFSFQITSICLKYLLISSLIIIKYSSQVFTIILLGLKYLYLTISNLKYVPLEYKVSGDACTT